MFNQEIFCKRLIELREEREWTQTDLANALGVTRPTVGHWELGIKKPTLDKVSQIAKLFSVSFDYLLGTSDVKNIDNDVNAKIIQKLAEAGMFDNRDPYEVIDEVIEEMIKFKKMKDEWVKRELEK